MAIELEVDVFAVR